MRGRIAIIVLGVLLVTTTVPAPASGADTLEVCETGCPYEKIQLAVDDAEPGDTVKIHAGVYDTSVPQDSGPSRDGVVVTTDEITIEGAGQGETVLDGDVTGERLDAYGIAVYADGVTVQQLTVRDYGQDGVYFDGVTGFYVHDVTAIDNQVYGIYAIRSQVGEITDSYATEHPDSGFYIGEVLNCECVIQNVHAEGNLLGYSGTAASHVTIKDSLFEDNAMGIVPNVLPNEPRPQMHLVVRDNVIRNNNNWTATEKWHFNDLHVPAGAGVTIAGGQNNVVVNNEITGHTLAGIALTWLFTEPAGNRILNNDLANADDDETAQNGSLPLEVFEDDGVDILWDGGGANNCFEQNTRVDEEPEVTFHAGNSVWDALGELPDCSTPNAGPPSPTALGRELSLLAYSCEPGDHLDDPDNCHQELV